MSDKTDVIEYTTADKLANVWRVESEAIREALARVEQATKTLRHAFGDSDRSGYHFGIDLYQNGSWHSNNVGEVNALLRRMELQAWDQVLDKLGVKQVMSSSRLKKLEEVVDGRGDESLPPLTAEAIVDVAIGMVGAVHEFLAEAIAEEYAWWKSSYDRQQNPKYSYRTNDGNVFKIGRKLIHGYMVRMGYGGTWDVHYEQVKHLRNLDSIMSMLDGKGPVKHHYGPLVAEIKTTRDTPGVGETEYFRFKCYGNGNLHLEFRREDLLAKFNRIAGNPDSIGDVMRKRA